MLTYIYAISFTLLYNLFIAKFSFYINFISISYFILSYYILLFHCIFIYFILFYYQIYIMKEIII